ncbi:type IV pilus biogenesis protein PilM [Noviherbaspirillum saxi]|uniref:Pilus assembly protein PilM n=1 Tax=Noviherbaspirillum saxi TaxID=2320863 RepID=A0A3A3FIB1_9BURK|nr:type IV pilus biogenesis protein PilM [Noviherbaspirillum saxi]RJF92128.1 pilus assembly protein PilM [Noviherbaspirillum saxi]
MWAIWILFAIGSVAGYFTVARDVQDTVQVQARAEDLAMNMGVYRAALVRYVAAHPGVNGVVQDSSIGLPSWYVRHPLWSNHVAGGKITVYASAIPPVNITREIVRLSQNSMLAGEANAGAGTLHSPIFGDTNIPLPSIVPDRAPVWIATIN